MDKPLQRPKHSAIARFFAVQKRAVCPLNQLFAGAILVVKRGNAAGGGNAEFLAFITEPLLAKFGAHPPDKALRAFHAGCQNNKKFLAAVSAGNISGPHLTRENFSELLEHPIACQMAMFIINFLKWSMSNITTVSALEIPSSSL
jgi:hypothetical protein